MLGKRPEMESLESKSSDSENFAPPTAVILCLRGEDPSLDACLKSLIAQDFPNFEIHFVLDSRQDPALNTIQNFLQENRDCQIKTKTVFLTENPETNNIIETCSLKNQALIAAISAAEETIEVIALVDADGVVQKDWLSSLIEPLADQKVGAATGSRWFDPRERNPGSIVRQTWNAAALPQMNFYNIPWGGALAIKRSTIEDCGNRPKHRINYALVSSQLDLATTADGSSPPQQLAAGARTCDFLRGLSARNCDRDLLVCLEPRIHADFEARDNTTYLFGRQRGLASSHSNCGPGFSGAMLTQLLYPLIAIKAALMQKVQWRGITYRILPGKKISMDDYRPYQANPSNSDASL